jgi:hypothetical protein
MARSKTPPKLTPEIVAANIELDAWISGALDAPDARRRSRVIRQLQEALRRQLTQRQWRAYLAIEQAVNARIVVESRVVVRAAFNAGRKARS